MGEGGKQSSEAEAVVAWKGCSKAPGRNLVSVCTILAHALQPQAGTDGERAYIEVYASLS